MELDTPGRLRSYFRNQSSHKSRIDQRQWTSISIHNVTVRNVKIRIRLYVIRNGNINTTGPGIPASNRANLIKKGTSSGNQCNRPVIPCGM